jgi:biopolymer transport protein ExbB
MQVAHVGEWLQLGGPVMMVLLLMSIGALTLILLKLWQFTDRRIGARDYLPLFFDATARGHWQVAHQALEGRPGPLPAVLRLAVLAKRDRNVSEADAREQVSAFAADEIERQRSLFRPLEVIATLAPLLGLLGTVMGMIEAFQRLQAAGDRVDPAILSGGIWQALLTTAAGLIVAIPVIAILNALERQVERLHRDTESALTRVFTRPIGGGVPGRDSTPVNIADAPPSDVLP